jgi:predicted RNA binding protein YcfA (HicA-like mRNA interferase family)
MREVGRDLVKLLEKAGYVCNRNGNHSIFEKPNARPVQVPMHTEIVEPLAKSILKQAGLDSKKRKGDK